MTEQEILIDRISKNWLTKTLVNSKSTIIPELTGTDLILEAAWFCKAKNMELALSEDCFSFMIDWFNKNKELKQN